MGMSKQLWVNSDKALTYELERKFRDGCPKYCIIGVITASAVRYEITGKRIKVQGRYSHTFEYNKN